MFGLRSSGSVHEIGPKVRKVRSSGFQSSEFGFFGFVPTLIATVTLFSVSDEVFKLARVDLMLLIAMSKV